MNKREKCLRLANEAINGMRDEQYGSPEDNFKTIARLWSEYLEVVISPVDVAMMMSLLKIARIKSGRRTGDSFVDIAGYAACGYEISMKQIDDDALYKATLAEYAPIEELARHMGVRD